MFQEKGRFEGRDLRLIAGESYGDAVNAVIGGIEDRRRSRTTFAFSTKKI